MAKYGGYETVSSTADSGLVTVWTARPVGSEPDELERFVIKVFHPIDLSAEGEETPAGLRGFLDAARVQGRAAAVKGAHWAPVHETGTSEDEAFYVTDYYAHSVEDLMRVQLDARAIHVILDSAVKGLRELKEECGRPHGNLKPTNVLITSGEDISRTKVFLTDPLPGDRMELSNAAVNDIRALGELIYQLVLHKAPHGLGQRVVQPSEAWRRLGRKGERWRELCSKLLMSPQDFSLEKIAEALEGLREAAFPTKRVAALVGVLVVVAAAALVVRLRAPRDGGPEESPWDKERWGRLCLEYHTWFAAFLGDMTTARRVRWRTEPHLETLVGEFEAAEREKVQFDPREIAHEPGVPIQDLIDNPPEEAMTRQASVQTAKALAVIDKVTSALFPSKPDQPTQWDKLARVEKLANAWQERNWHQAARYLSSFVEAVKADAKLARAVDNILELDKSKLVDSIRWGWAEITKYQEKFKSTGDQVLVKFEGWALAETRSEPDGGSQKDLEALQKKLDRVQSLGKELAAAAEDMLSGRINRELFAKNGGVHRGFDGTVMEHTFRNRWLKEIKDYYILADDPRGKDEDWKRKIARVEGDIAELEKLGGEAKRQAAKFRSKLSGEVKDRIAEMWALVPIRRDEHLLKRSADQAAEEVKQLDSKVQGAIVFFAGSPKDWLVGTRKSEVSSSPAIKTAWDRAKRALLDNVKAEVLQADKEKYLALRAQVQELRGSLERLDDELPKDMPAEAKKHLAKRWYDAFLSRMRGKREEALRESLGAAGGKDVPDLGAADFQKTWDGARQKFLRWRDEAGKVVAAFGTIEDGLDGCHLLSEALSEGGKPLGELHQESSRSPILEADDELRRAVAAVSQRVTGLRDVQTLQGRSALAERGLSTTAREVALAAWRMLGKLTNPPWPTGAEEFDQETKMRQRLASELRAIPEAARRQVLQDELVQGGQLRDLRWYSAHVQALRQTIEASGDKILAQFGTYVDGELKGLDGNPESRLTKLKGIRPLAEELTAVVQRDWEKGIARDLFTQAGSVYRDLESGRSLTAKTFGDWLKEAKQYYYLPEDSLLVKRNRALDEEEKNVRQAIAGLEKGGEKEKTAASDLLARLKQEVEPRNEIPAIRKNEAQLARRVDTAEQALKTLKEGVGKYYVIIRLENEIAALVKTIEGSNDTILAQFGKHVDAETQGSGQMELEARRAKLAEVNSFATRFATLVKGDWAENKIHRKLFAEESQVHRDFGSAQTVDRKILEAWLAEVKGYYTLEPDPRGSPDQWNARAGQVRDLIVKLEKFGGEYKQKGGELRAALSKMVSQSIEPLWSMAAVEKNREKLVAMVGAADKKLADLKASVEMAFEREPQWRERVQKLVQVASSGAVNQEWVKQRDKVLGDYPPEKLQESSELYLSVRTQFEGLVLFFKGLDDKATLPLPPSDWGAQFAAEGNKKREQALGKVVAGVRWAPSGFPAQTLEQFKQGQQWRDACAEYSQALSVLGSVQRDGALAERLFKEGYLPDDKPDDAAKTMREIYDAWQKQGISPELLRPFERVVQWIRVLIQFERAGRPQLVDQAKAIKASDPPQLTMVVWRGLGKLKDWPSDLDELKLEAQVRGRLAAAAAKVKAKNPHPVRWVEGEMAKEGSRRWEVCFNKLVSVPAPKGDPDANVRACIGLASQFDVASGQLAPQTQFRRLLFDFRREVFALPDSTKSDAVLARVAAFQGKVPSGLSAQASVAQLFKEIRAVLERADDEGPVVALQKAGPAAPKLSGAWQAAVAEDGKSVEYTWTAKPLHKLHFVRVEPRGGGGKPVYLCTTEVSASLFIDVIQATGKWEDIKALLNMARLAGIDPRKGPRVWRPTRDGSAVQISRGWLVRLPGVDPYPKESTPRSASGAHPMQYVSPEAALCLARLLGCRLPTSLEWSGAYDVYEKGKPGAKRNLRDKTWQLQLEHVRKLKQAGRNADWPDAGIFVPSDANVTAKAGAEAALVADAADGQLWFEPTDSGTGMRHLVGNVAEFVYDGSAAFEGAFKDINNLSASSLRKFLTQGAGDLKVVGGSAVSPPEYWNGADRPFDRALNVNLEQARLGYSDVGFRLAFTAPRDSPASRVARVLRKQGYLAELK